MIELIELDNGNLELRLTNREDFEQMLERNYEDERAYLVDMLDCSHYIGNDWEVPTYIGLTEAPAIGYGMIWDDERDEDDFIISEGVNVIDWEKLWVFDDYMIKDYLQELKEKGSVIFKQV